MSTMTARPRRTFTPEFKAHTVELIRTSGKSVSLLIERATLTNNSPVPLTINVTLIDPTTHAVVLSGSANEKQGVVTYDLSGLGLHMIQRTGLGGRPVTAVPFDVSGGWSH